MTRKQKDAYIAARKRELVEVQGCIKCGAGGVPTGFERYWFVGGQTDEYYDSRRFVFKYAEPRDSDVPVSKLSRAGKTKEEIDDALARCVILCRSCADPRRTRKDEQCQETTATNTSPLGS